MKPTYGIPYNRDCINNNCDNVTHWSDDVCQICRKKIPKHIPLPQYYNFYKGKNDNT